VYCQLCASGSEDSIGPTQTRKLLERQDDLREQYRAVEAEPQRIRKQIEVVVKARESMADDLKRIMEK
jgi:hypothetical protein